MEKRLLRKVLPSMVSASMMLSLAMPVVQATEPVYQPGYTVEKNTDFPESDAKYQVTFVFEDKDARDATKVELFGGFEFYKPEEVGGFVGMGDNSGIPVYTPQEYKDGMFVAGNATYFDMKEVGEDVFSVTLPLPGNQYYYDYYVYYDGDTTRPSKYIEDPVNPAPGNDNSGYDAGHSLALVGDESNTAKGQEKIYPRFDGQKGKVEYVTYTANDGTSQHLGVYLPYGYDSSKIYKTIYVSHGGGGNEAEWMTIGSVPNIMDNLIAEGDVADCVVVTMDNQHTWGWDYQKIADNFVNSMIPYIESHYSVSKSADDRALCGLSMGSMTTNKMVSLIPETFRYYGAFSGGSQNYTSSDYDVNKINGATYYITAGCVDMAYNNKLGISTVDYTKVLDSIGVDYKFELKNGAHDWYVWRDSFTTFAKDYLWDENQELVKPGVTVTEGSVNKDANYTAKFVYEDQDPRDAVSVSVSGNLQWYETAGDFYDTGSAKDLKAYNAFEYKKGMFNTGYGLNGDTAVYELTEVKDERFEIDIPLPGNLYYYDYTITYKDGAREKVTIQDPANPSPKNDLTGKDSGHSLFYVGNSADTTKGQEYIYARDDKKGTFKFVEYTAIDGSTQSLGVYLPNGFDASKSYKTLYVSHGGGGNEAEWSGIGAMPNIMDNLIADGEVEDTVVVTMNNNIPDLLSDGGRTWYYDKIAKNFKDCIIPYMEQNYNVSKDVKDRALCGLSMGSMTTTTIMLSYTDLFDYYGCFSGANTNADLKDVEELKGKTIYLTAGSVDMALMGDTYGTENDNKTRGLADRLTKLGVEYGMDTQDGAHDWGVWRASLTTFVKDYLWNKDETKDDTQPTQPSTDEKKPTQTVDQKKPTTTSKVKTGDDVAWEMMAVVALLSAGAFVTLKKKMH